MMDIPGSKKAAAPYWFERFPNNDTVHLHACPYREIFSSKFVFCRNVGFQSVRLRIEGDPCTSLQIGQCDQHGVAWIEFEHLIRHGNNSFFLGALIDEARFLRHCRTPRAFRRATIRSGPQSPELRGVAAKNGFALFRWVPVKVILDKIR